MRNVARRRLKVTDASGTRPFHKCALLSVLSAFGISAREIRNVKRLCVQYARHYENCTVCNLFISLACACEDELLLLAGLMRCDVMRCAEMTDSLFLLNQTHNPRIECARAE